MWRMLFSMFLVTALVQTSFAQTQPPTPTLFSATQPIVFQLAANAYTAQPAFDLPAGITRFRVDMTTNSANDLDLFLRQGDPFPAKNTYSQTLSFGEIQEFAQQFSISASGNETILVSDASARKAKAGRYFVSVFNGGNTTADVTLRLVLNPPVDPTRINVRFDLPCQPNETDCNCSVAEWNDPTTIGFVSPGNSATTLGQKRRNALLAAVQQIANELQNEQVTTVRACWAKLRTETESTTLAQTAGYSTINDYSLARLSGGAVQLNAPFRSLPLTNTWHSGAVTNRYNGTRGCGSVGGDCTTHAEMEITFNTAVDTPEGLGSRSFYYGLTPIGAGSQDVDFVSVSTHEILHGLGYADALSETGAELRGRDDIFARNIAQVDQVAGTVKNLSSFTDAQRLSILTGGQIYWIGQQGLAQGAVLQAGEVGLKMFAPSTYQAGSTLSHLDNTRFVDELMRPSYRNGIRSLGLAAGQLRDVGWLNPVGDIIKPKIYPGNWFDPRRNNHGIDIQAIANIDGTNYNKMLLTFYTYDDQGDPEYYISTGNIVDSAYLPDTFTTPTGRESSIGRYFVRNGVISADPNFSGRLRLDFLQAERSAACTDGQAAPAKAINALFVTGNQITNWCMQPLADRPVRPANDFSGHWFSANDGGWGISIVNAVLDGKALVNVLLYYPDAQGNPRWAYAQSNDFRSGQTLTIKQRKGYCRNCTPTAPIDTDVGSMTLKLDDVIGNFGGNNEITFNVRFNGPAGGTFARTNAKLMRLAQAPRDLD